MSVETSIIIRTLNESKYLENLLKGIHSQNYRDWEIVLVDSGSTDGTPDIAQRYGARIFHIPKDEFTFGRSLNIGCAQAEGRYLVFASGHVWPITNSWLSNLVKPFDEDSVAMVFGRQRGTKTNRLSELRDLELAFGAMSHILLDEAKGNNGNAAIRRDLWLDQPFDEDLPGMEDIDWARKAESNNHRVYYAADAGVYHVHEETLKQVYTRNLREAVAVKWMYPNYRFSLADLAKGLPAAIARDFLYGVGGSFYGKLFQVPATRIAHFFGIYNGVRYQNRLGHEIMRRLETPDSYMSVVVDSPGTHGIQRSALPELKPDEVLVQVAFAGVSPEDVQPPSTALKDGDASGIGYPFVPGKEFSGIIVKTGDKVSNLRLGEKVTGVRVPGCGNCPACWAGEYQQCAVEIGHSGSQDTGFYTDYAVVRSSQLHGLPAKIPLKYGVMVAQIAQCLTALEKVDAQVGASVCILGAGSLGNLFSQIFQSRGFHVTVIDSNQRWLSLLHRYDIDTLTSIDDFGRYDLLVAADGSSEISSLVSQIAGSSPRVLIMGDYLPIDPSNGQGTASDYIRMSGTAPSVHWKEAMLLVNKGIIKLEDHTVRVEPLENYRTVWDGFESNSPIKVLLLANKELAAL